MIKKGYIMSKLRILALGTVAAIAMAPTTGAFAIDTARD